MQGFFSPRFQNPSQFSNNNMVRSIKAIAHSLVSIFVLVCLLLLWTSWRKQVQEQRTFFIFITATLPGKEVRVELKGRHWIRGLGECCLFGLLLIAAGPACFLRQPRSNRTVTYPTVAWVLSYQLSTKKTTHRDLPTIQSGKWRHFLSWGSLWKVGKIIS